MKKFISILAGTLAFIGIVASAHATINVGWNATSTDPGFIQPNAVNGNTDAINVPYVISNSTTATSTFNAPLHIWSDQANTSIGNALTVDTGDIFLSMGSTLVTNGTFNTNLSGWTINGTAAWDASQAASMTGSGSGISQGITVTPALYRFTFTVNSMSAGGLAYNFMVDGNTNIGVVFVPGTYYVDRNVVSSANIAFSKTGSGTAVIDDVLLQPQIFGPTQNSLVFTNTGILKVNSPTATSTFSGGLSVGGTFNVSPTTGFIGLGVTNPQYQTDIQGNLQYQDGMGTYILVNGDNNLYEYANNNLKLDSEGYTLINTVHSGLVGIATTTPLTQLDVAGDITDENLLNAGCTGTDGNGKFKSVSCGGVGTISTSTSPTLGNLAYWTGSGYPSTLGKVATSSETCTSPVSCSSFNIVGTGGAISLGTVGVANGGTGAATFGQGWIRSAGGTGALTSSTSPTVNYITATSTTVESTFNDTLNVTTNDLMAQSGTPLLTFNIACGAAYFGDNAGRNENCTSGINNMYIGSFAGNGGTSAQLNVAVGVSALRKNVTGSQNVAIGSNAQGSQNGGGDNVAIGYSALSWNNGTGNGALNRDVGIGSYSFLNVNSTLAVDNIGIGYATGQNITSGAQNTFIGSQAGYSDGIINSLVTGNNMTAIGYGAQVMESNAMVLGGVNNFEHVGIGTTTPSTNAQFQVTENGTTTADILVGTPNSAGGEIIMVDATAGHSACTEIYTVAGVVLGKVIACPAQ